MAAKILFPLALILSAPLAAQDSIDAPRGWDPSQYDLDHSEFSPEAAWRFGRLENGVRYIIRRNDRPESTALVRMVLETGSLDELAREQGFAHYVEHMAFNGSTRVPEGEMIKLLERLGLAFGADTNASTGFDRTQYKLDLPRADAELLDTALMLMRETASELTFDEEAVQREKGVILSERRVRNSYAYKNLIDSLEFAYPQARLPRRIPIGTVETIEAADAKALRAFWEREYVPADTVIVVVGDFDPDLVESEIREHFASWQPAASPDQPHAGPVDPNYAGQTDIYVDPALTESVTILRHAAFVETPDTAEERVRALRYAIGLRALGRRLQRLQRSEDPPFRGVNAYTTDQFDIARTTQIAVSVEDGGWRRGVDAAIAEYRRALEYGFSAAEIAEQVSNIRTGRENAAANAATRSNSTLTEQAIGLTSGERVPTAPAENLAFFEAHAASITPETVLEALRAEMVPLDNPLIRFTGKSAPEGGAAALRDAVAAAFARAVEPPQESAAVDFAYTDFGEPGEIVSDTRTAQLDIRTLRFSNGVMLNLKPTDLADDRVQVQVRIDGGRMLATRDDPLAVEIAGLLPSGGLGRHSRDELQTILAGRSVGSGLGTGADAFVASSTTTPRDLELQLQLFAAFLTDPGYRAEGLGPWRKGLEDFFARLGRTPSSALGEALGAILSDDDPRFTRQPLEAYRALDYASLNDVIGDRLANGAIEIALVGDFDEAEAIDFVARTFGALPQRETAFRAYDDAQRDRSFTDTRGPREVLHRGEADQALIRYVWPTADNTDWDLTSRLTLLGRVMQLELTETLREELGQTYSPRASSDQSSVYRGYGSFSLGAEVDVAQVDATHAAIAATVRRLIAEGPSADTVDRARKPLLEGLENRLKTNGGWMSLVDKAQSKPEDIERFLQAKARQESITPEELRALTGRYLTPDDAVVVTVLPDPEITEG